MKFKIETAALQDAVRALSIVTKANTTDPEGRVLIRTNEGSVSFISNNNSTAISIDIEKVTVEEEGSVSILFSKIRSFISSFSAWSGDFGAKEFVLTEKDNKLGIKVNNVFENGKKSNGSLNIELYPTIMVIPPDPIKEPNFIISTETYKMAVTKVIYAVDPGEIRQNIQGMYLYFDEDYIYFTGTNGFMLSEYKAKNTSNIKSGGYILKHDFIMALRRAIVDESQIFFEITERTVKARIDNITLSGRLIIGEEYPEYKHLFEKFDHSITVNKDILMSSLMPFMDVLETEDNKRITLSIGDNKLNLKNDYAEFSYDEDIDFKNGAFEIDVNCSFMKQTV